MIDRPSGDPLADWARSGVMWLTGHADGPPLVPPGNAASLARQIGARLAAVVADPSFSERVDAAPLHPAFPDTGVLLAERAAFTGYRRQGRFSPGGGSRLLPASDGWAVVSCARPDDLPLLSALVGAELPDDPWPAITTWLRTHDRSEFAERAGLLGLPAAPVGWHTLPGVPSVGRLRSPADLLVVDFSALWAGPLCAHLLGLAGARIVKVETPQRLDGARGGNPGFYDLLHAGHHAVMLDPETPAGRRALAGLVAAADIVIEASRPRALASFGVDAQAAVGQGTIWVSITAAGRDSPQVGFGDDVTASVGLVAWDEKVQPVFCGDALADPLTGLVAAELAMSAPVGGHGKLFDLAMSGVVAATLASPPASHAPPACHSPTARRAGPGWVIDTECGPVPVAPPRARPVMSRAAAPGEHTELILRELQIPGP